ncbi:unnamed protein product [Polarella glacialis]|uniref:C2H2-type domain-containing protein n=1 Tax=Polarella glacialis TaxID=89957 RepID=A0A813GA59_POLGL|nr:unnamed protein product [Polarella glacialis]
MSEDDGDADSDEDSDEQVGYFCEPCRKRFQSEKAFDQHAKSKKHLQVVAKLRKHLEREMEEDDDEEENIDIEAQLEVPQTKSEPSRAGAQRKLSSENAESSEDEEKGQQQQKQQQEVKAESADEDEDSDDDSEDLDVINYLWSGAVYECASSRAGWGPSPVAPAMFPFTGMNMFEHMQHMQSMQNMGGMMPPQTGQSGATAPMQHMQNMGGMMPPQTGQYGASAPWFDMSQGSLLATGHNMMGNGVYMCQPANTGDSSTVKVDGLPGTGCPESMGPSMRHPGMLPFANFPGSAASVEASPVHDRRQLFPDDVDTVLSMINRMSADARKSLFDKLGVSSVSTDFDSSLKHAVSLVVQVEHMDGNDVGLVSEAIIQFMSKLTNSEVLGVFVAQMLHHHSTVYALPEGSTEKIRRHQELNKLMITRIIDLQPEDTRKFWLREGIKPVAASSNEREMFFEMHRIVNFGVSKHKIKACMLWIRSNLPAQHKKPTGEKPAGEDRVKRSADQLGSEGSSNSGPQPKILKPTTFDINTYTFANFKTDAADMTRLSDGSELLSVKEATSLSSVGAAQSLKVHVVNFELALENVGLTPKMKDAVFPTFKLATQSLGLKADKRSIDELRRYLKNSPGSLWPNLCVDVSSKNVLYVFIAGFTFKLNAPLVYDHVPAHINPGKNFERIETSASTLLNTFAEELDNLLGLDGLLHVCARQSSIRWPVGFEFLNVIPVHTRVIPDVDDIRSGIEEGLLQFASALQDPYLQSKLVPDVSALACDFSERMVQAWCLPCLFSEAKWQDHITMRAVDVIRATCKDLYLEALDKNASEFACVCPRLLQHVADKTFQCTGNRTGIACADLVNFGVFVGSWDVDNGKCQHASWSKKNDTAWMCVLLTDVEPVLEFLFSHMMFFYGKAQGRQTKGIMMGSNIGGAVFRLVLIVHEMQKLRSPQMYQIKLLYPDVSIHGARLIDDVRLLIVFPLSMSAGAVQALANEVLQYVYPPHLILKPDTINPMVGMRIFSCSGSLAWMSHAKYCALFELYGERDMQPLAHFATYVPHQVHCVWIPRC